MKLSKSPEIMKSLFSQFCICLQYFRRSTTTDKNSKDMTSRPVECDVTLSLTIVAAESRDHGGGAFSVIQRRIFARRENTRTKIPHLRLLEEDPP
ncbi:hypothetical protein TNCT_592691 [Trichonephila clavata]|uniref:Uncharacterized protein n=1 Tax=Trichonephila clavata TaxID=2740835 RepID=A0A8X6M2B7_TRICU|nr:hypothetical protein TNCT_592691 [Trichonephila clavata]